MIDWQREAVRGRSFVVNPNGEPIQASREGLQKGEFIVRFSKSRCAKCREFLWIGSVARYGRESKKPEHVTCPR
jgi:hypothetical protein